MLFFRSSGGLHLAGIYSSFNGRFCEPAVGTSKVREFFATDFSFGGKKLEGFKYVLVLIDSICLMI